MNEWKNTRINVTNVEEITTDEELITWNLLLRLYAEFSGYLKKSKRNCGKRKIHEVVCSVPRPEV
jgi:hypothetical protein